MRIQVISPKGIFYLCSWCGYLCKVDGNRYIYNPILELGIDIHPDTKYSVDNHYNVVTIQKSYPPETP
jgi:Fe-S-cluster containining protein